MVASEVRQVKESEECKVRVQRASAKCVVGAAVAESRLGELADYRIWEAANPRASATNALHTAPALSALHSALRTLFGTASAYPVTETIMNKDELDGKAQQIKGKIKQGVGDATDNARLHDEGVADEAGGEVQEGFGKGKRKIGEAIEDLGEKIKH